MNKVILTGNVVADAKRGTTKTNKVFSRFSIAVANMRESALTNFFDCYVYGEYAEKIEKFILKGRKICVIGSLNQSKYKDKNNQDREYVCINVETIELLSKVED